MINTYSTGSFYPIFGPFWCRQACHSALLLKNAWERTENRVGRVWTSQIQTRAGAEAARQDPPLKSELKTHKNKTS